MRSILCFLLLLQMITLSAQSNSWLPVGNGIGEGPGYVYDMIEHEGLVYIAGYRLQPEGDFPGADLESEFLVTDGIRVEEATPFNFFSLRTAYALASYKGGILVGGDFTEINGDPKKSGIAFWDGTHWHAIGEGVNDDVTEVYVTEDEEIIIGGNFTMSGDKSIRRIAKWNGQGWEQIGEGLSVRPLTITEFKGELYAGGFFTTDSGGRGMGKWNGSFWEQICDNLGPNQFVEEMVPVGDDYLMVAGGMTATCVSGNDPFGQDVLFFDGINWSVVGSNTLSSANDVAYYQDSLYVVGRFFEAGEDENAQHIAKLGTNGDWEFAGVTLNRETQDILVTSKGMWVGGGFNDALGNEKMDLLIRYGPDLGLGLGVPINDFRMADENISGIIEASNSVIIGGNTVVDQQAEIIAGKCISLQPGFHAPKGTTFSARILGQGDNFIDLPTINQVTTNMLPTSPRSSFEIYPNPAARQFTLLGNMEGSYALEWQLVNVGGQVILPRQVAPISGDEQFSISIALPRLSDGIYFLQVSSAVENQVLKLIIRN